MNGPAMDPVVLVPDDEVFVRMSRPELWQHGLVMASFSVLALTGLPLLAADIGIVRIAAGRGFGSILRGTLHRGAALVFVAVFVWQLLYAVLSARGRKNFRDRLPQRRDFADALAFFRVRSARPEFGRYGFAGKFEYWSQTLGSLIMIVTGAFMLSPGSSLRLFPLRIHQLFVVVHGCEAVLAVLAILIWHIYNAHLDPRVFPMSRVWLDGRMTGAELRRSHPLEYRRILESREGLFREILALEPGDGDDGPDGGRPPAS
jgi:formate dehydrogenase subunit gamma